MEDQKNQIQKIKAVMQELESGAGWHIPNEIYQQIAKDRRSPTIKFMAKLCRDFLSAYENYNFDIQANGELRVIRTLAKGHDESVHIFDVGANIGDWSLAAAINFPNAMIHSFEIVPQTYQKLAKNVERHKAIIANNFGLMDYEGIIDIRFFPEKSYLSTITKHDTGQPFEIINGKVTTGDAYMKKHGISNIRFLKVDVEGAEHSVLEGFSQALDHQRIDAIQFEYGTVNITTKYLLTDYYNWLGSKGYKIGKIFPDHVEFKEYEYIDENFLGPNYLAVSKKRKNLIETLS